MKKVILLSFLLLNLLSVIAQSETESNNTFALANKINFNAETSGTVGNPDAADYFKIVMPEDGTFTLYVQGQHSTTGNHWLQALVYDGRTTSALAGSYVASASVAINTLVKDTFEIKGIAADTIYVRLNSSATFSYSIRCTLSETSTKDAEPNNSFSTAVILNPGQTFSGSAGYKYRGVTDANDYYKVELPKDGTVKFFVEGTMLGATNGWISITAFNGAETLQAGEPGGGYLENNASAAYGTTLSDSLTLKARYADTFYLKVNAPVACKYSVRFEYTDTSTRDREPNNTIAEAIILHPNQVAEGNKGFKYRNTSDPGDYYKAPGAVRGSVSVIIEGINRSNVATAALTVYNAKKTDSDARFLSISNFTYGQYFRDTLQIPCFDSDSMFIRIVGNAAYSYSLSYTIGNSQPKASMENERLGNTIGFRPQLANADAFHWDFGDGTISTAKYPMKTYQPGFYTAKLIARNSFCNLRDTATQNYEIVGVEYFTPNKGGAGGDVVMSIFGGGLDTTTQVKLVKGNIEILPNQKYTNSIKNHLSAIFDLHFAEEGFYDVVISIPGQPVYTKVGGFEIEDFIYPATWSEIQGPTRFRTNRDTPFNLVVGNKGNVMASGVVVALVWPKDVSLNFKNGIYRPNPNDIMTVTTDDGEVYSHPVSEYMFIYDSLITITPIDSFEGQPYDGYIWHLLIPHVPANSTMEFPLIAKTANLNSNTFITYTFKPNMFGSGAVPNYDDFQNDMLAEICDIGGLINDKANNPYLKTFISTAKIGNKHMGAYVQLASKKFWAVVDEYEYDEQAALADYWATLEGNNAYAIQTARDELAGLMYDYGIAKTLGTYQKQIGVANKKLANNPTMSLEESSKYLDALINATAGHDRLEKLDAMFKTTKKFYDETQLYEKIKNAVTDCPELKKQEKDLKEYGNEVVHHKDVRKKESNSVTSMDPNEIVGPAGIGENGYVLRENLQHYLILFENKASAGAAAQIVTICDTLDITKFDVNSFEFGSLNIGPKNIRVPNNRSEFVMEHVQSSSMHVRINGELNKSNGVITWQFTAIDPATGDIPVFDGFLPPNVTAPEGEGSVSYTIKPLATLTDGTELTNRASIIFDENEAIITNTWKNTIDVGLPNSSITAHRIAASDSVVINLAGSDASSGVGYYNIYIKKDSEEWISFGGSSSEKVMAIIPNDASYSFYAVAEDMVGNVEVKSPKSEATIDKVVGLKDRQTVKSNTFIYPNPASDQIRIRSGELLNGQVYIKIYNITGEEIFNATCTLEQNTDLPINLPSKLNTGTYIINLLDENGQSFTQKFMINK